MTGPCALVTGAGGFIGSYLTEALIRKGYRVTALVHYRGDGSTGFLALPGASTLPEAPEGQLEIVQGDVRDVEHMRKLCAGKDFVFHLAANPSISNSYVAPRTHAEINAIGTLNVLAATLASRDSWHLRAEGLGPVLIYMSSSEVYGSAQSRGPMTEQHPLVPQSPYAASKLAGEHLCTAYARSYGLDVRIARCFNVYGPRQSPRSVIPNIITQALALPMPGGEIRVGSFSVARDFTYVTDTVAALVALAEAPRATAGSAPYNVGTGRAISIEEIVECVGEVLGTTLCPILAPELQRPAASDVDLLLADASRIRAALGWEPRVRFTSGLLNIVRWMKMNPDRVGSPAAATLPPEHRAR
jgi:nucleoside-diphosphate-sugar epimerase